MKIKVAIVKPSEKDRGWWIFLVLVAVCLFVQILLYQSAIWDMTDVWDVSGMRLWPYWAGFALSWVGLGLLLLSLTSKPCKATGPGVAWCVLAVALVARVVVVCGTQPVLSDDIWRYIHDGATLGNGVNPYAAAPDDLLASRVPAPVPGVMDRINNPSLVTIYQPTSQVVFAALDRVWELSPSAWQRWDPNHDKTFRFGFVLFDMAIIGLILFQLRSMGRSAWWAAAYAWHPLTISEVAGSGHQDVIGIAFLLLALVLAARLERVVTVACDHRRANPPAKPGAEGQTAAHEIKASLIRKPRGDEPGTTFGGESGDESGGKSGGKSGGESGGESGGGGWLIALGAGVAFGLAVGVKPVVLPIALALAWTLRHRPRLVALSAGATVLTGAAIYLPFVLMDGGLAGMIETTRTFIDKWSFNASAYDLVSTYIVGKPWIDYLAMAVLLAVIAVTLSKKLTGQQPDAARSAGAFLFASLLVSSTAHPWYLLWALALLPLYFSWALWILSLTVVASYAAHLYPGYRVPMPVVIGEYLPVYAVLGWGCLRALRRAPLV